MIKSSKPQENTKTKQELKNTTEAKFENTLRPKTLQDFIGQQSVKQNLEICIKAAQNRGDSLEHVLLYGSPGIGKTTLAHIIANEQSGNLRVTSGPAIKKAGDVAAILTSLKKGDVLFIDEIHRLNKTIEETLYSALEDYKLDIILGKGPSAKSVELKLEKFTLIGATTRIALLTSAFRDRFGHIFRLNFYDESHIQQIVERSAHILGADINNEAALEIARRSRRTPRIANRLLKRVRDVAEVTNNGIISKEIANEALEMLNIDTLGLDQVDRRILETIVVKFTGGPVGLSTIAHATSEEKETIEDVYEPFLLQLGFIDRTPKGRIATPKAYEHLKIKPA